MTFSHRRTLTALSLLSLFAYSAARAQTVPDATAQTTTASVTLSAPTSGADTPSVTNPPLVAAPTEALAVQHEFVDVASRVKQSVVTIYCEELPKAPKIDPKTGKVDAKAAPDDGDGDDEGDGDGGGDDDENLDPTQPRTSLGTGIVVSSDGYIVTNYHVVRGADVVRVLFNADTENPDRPLAKVVGYDEESDLAVIKVPRTNLTPATFGNSDKVAIGDWAIAIGAPFDQPETVTVGVISAKSRHLDRKGQAGLQDYLQTDASINPGNSGGPLIDCNGEVVGINTAILSPSRFSVGIGFSVPSNTVERLLPVLMSGQSVRRGFLGIQYVKLSDDVAKAFGVTSGMQIGALAKKDGAYIGPAKDAGLREDDIITAVNGEPVISSDQFRTIVSTTPPGATIKFAVTRPTSDKPQSFDVTVTLGDWNAQFGDKTAAAPAPAPAPLGLGLEVSSADKLSDADREKYGIDDHARGAVITKVAPGSPAEDADLDTGLRIVRARIAGDWSVVPNGGTWLQLIKTAPAGSSVLMQLRDRDDVSVYKVIVVPDDPAPAPPTAVATVKTVGTTG